MPDLRPLTTPRSPRASTRSVGYTWRVTGLLVFLVGTGIPGPFIIAAVAGLSPTAAASLGVVIGNPFVEMACLFIGGYFAIRGRQLRSRACAQAVLADSRPPVVYLRSFRSERPIIGYLMMGILLPTWIFELFYSEEEQLAESLNEIGPFVAVGKPGETLPKLGATRIYVRDVIWQDTVQHKLKQANLIIIRAGVGEGLWWEIGQSFRTVHPTRILVLVLRMLRKDYIVFAERVRNDFGVAMPLVSGGPGRLSGILGFDSHWRPVTLALKAPIMRVTVSKPLRALYAYALRPVYGDLGIRWVAPPLSAAKLVMIALLLLLVVGTLVGL
jgi:hypothetical protein